MAQETLQQTGAPAAEAVTVDDFASLLQREFKPNTDAKQARIEEAVKTLAQQALEDTQTIGADVFSTVDALKAAIDRKLTEQVNKIIHHEEFQRLESAWRGLWYLVGNTPTGKDLKVRVLNVSKDETRKMLRQFRDAAWDQSPLFKKIYEAEFGQLGGQPYGAFICDYNFDHTAPDIEVMKGLAKIGAAAHAPFIAAADSQLLGMESWQELANPRDIAKQFDATDYMGVRITEAFKTYGWCTRIRGVESGGTVEDLPTAMFPTDDGAMDAKCPTEIAISDRREAELSKAGLMALVHRKNTDQATFIGAQTLHAPKAYEDADATASANLSARLPYIFASCRFAHYLKCMVRDWIGSSREAPVLASDLQSWIMQYVDMQPDFSTEEDKARKPLKSASVDVIPDPENPGYYRGVFRMVPHYQLEGMDVSLSMVSRLPKGPN
jgi:type VI secretion system protein ImpC